MATTNLVRSATAILDAIEEGVASGKRASAARRLSNSLLKCIATGTPSVALPEFARTRRGLVRQVDALHRAASTRTLAGALYRHLVMRQSRARSIKSSDANATDFRFAMRLADRLGVDIADLTALADERDSWVAAIRGEAERMEVFLDQRAAEDMLLAALEAYSVPRSRRRRYRYEEIYGICVGSVRQVETTRRGRGLDIVTYVNVTRCATQLRAEGTASTVYPNDESFRVQIAAANALFPQLEIVGDFHSHPYPTVRDMRAADGWWYSEVDQDDNPRWVREIAESGHRARVAFIIAVAKQARSRAEANPQAHGPHTHRLAIEGHQFVIGAYRTLTDGSYSVERTRLHCQATNVS